MLGGKENIPRVNLETDHWLEEELRRDLWIQNLEGSFRKKGSGAEYIAPTPIIAATMEKTLTAAMDGEEKRRPGDRLKIMNDMCIS